MRLQPVATSLFTSHIKEATRNCSPVAISCGSVQLPVRVKSCNWTLKHYPLRAPSSFRGRAREQEHPQRQSMGYPPTTHHHDTQGKPPTHEDMCLTTSRLAPHKPAHKAFSSVELNEPCELRPLYEHFSNSEKMLDEVEGQLFPEFNGTEHPHTVHILREEWAEGKLKALFFRVNNKLYAYIDNAAQQAYGNIRMGVPPHYHLEEP